MACAMQAASHLALQMLHQLCSNIRQLPFHCLQEWETYAEHHTSIPSWADSLQMSVMALLNWFETPKPLWRSNQHGADWHS